jgi:hypothetical protein
MEISPIAGIRVMPAAKEQSAEAGLTAYFYIDPTARSGDDRYTGGGKKAAGAEEDDPEDSGEELEVQPAMTLPEDRPTGSINYFA